MSASVRKLSKKLTADKKKLSLMIVLSAALLLLWGRLLLKQVPRTARADPESVVATVADPGDAPVLPRLRHTVYLDLPRVLERDIFGLDRTRYQGPIETVGSATPRKSPLNPPDDEMEAIRVWAGGLELQAAVLGDEPTAMINERIYRVGDSIGGSVVENVVIDGFVLTSVKPRLAVLSRGEIRIQLEMLGGE